ncbi:hypothetical protein H4R27_004029 [Coemansia aciculifera]|nr:hypothetical protein H4R27_004029 [Coemansia aciculifera]
MLAVALVFYRPKERLEESDAAREKFFVPESDHLTLLNLYLQWCSNWCRDSWCTRHFVHSKSMRKASEACDQLEYMQCATAIDPKWLAKMELMFFSLRDSGASRKKHADLHQAKTESEFQLAQEEEAARAAAERLRVQRCSASRSHIVTPGCANNIPRFKTPPRRTNL